jgi:hypothetical protein
MEAPSDPYPMDKLLAKLSEQQAAIREQNAASKRLEEEPVYSRVLDLQSSCSSLPITPATESFIESEATTRSATATPSNSTSTTEELLRLKLELAKAKNKISRLDQELAQSRLAKTESGRVTPVKALDQEYQALHGLDQVTGRLSMVSGVPPVPAIKTQSLAESVWSVPEDCSPDISDPVPNGSFTRSKAIWGNSKPSFGNSILTGPMPLSESTQPLPWPSGRGGPSAYMETGNTPAYNSVGVDNFRGDRLTPDHDMMMRPPSGRRSNRYENRFSTQQSFGGGYGTYNLSQGHYDTNPGYSSGGGPVSHAMGLNMYPQYQSVATGTALSPHATEFTSSASAWKTDVSLK